MPTGTGIAKAFFGLIFDKFICYAGSDNGFGNGYTWASSLDSGLQIAARESKPLMLIIHKSYCKACVKLKSRLSNSYEVQELSKLFVMVNAEDGYEPAGNAYSPDGNYVPRIFFISPSGKVDHAIYNEGGETDAKYFYIHADQVAKAMKKALAKYQ